MSTETPQKPSSNEFTEEPQVFENTMSLRENKTEQKKSKKGLLIGVGSGLAGVAIAAGAVFGINASNQAPEKEDPVATAPAEPGENGGETGENPTLTYQEEIQKAIEARPAEGPKVEVSGEITEANAQSWVDTLKSCLQSGNIDLSEDNRTMYIAYMKGPIIENVANDFKLEQNFDTCTSELFVDIPANVKGALLGTNISIVSNQLAGNSSSIRQDGPLEMTRLDDGSVNVLTHQIMTTSAGNEITDEMGGHLANVDGTLKWIGIIS